MKKIALSLASIIMLASSCTRDLTSLNVDPKNPSIVPSASLFTNAQRVLARTQSATNVNLNNWRLVVQYWQETTYTDESNYDFTTRKVPDFVWNAYYRDILKDFKESSRLVPGDVRDAGTQKNMIAISDIMQVYTWYYLVTTFGNVPYTEALDIAKTFPKFDDQKAVYADLLTRLDADIAALNVAGESFGSSDIVYGGDVAAWKKFAISFKLKMGMTIADDDAAKAKTVVEAAAAAGVFASNADNALFTFQSSPPNTSYLWEDLVQSGRKDFVANSTIVTSMLDLHDPRVPLYFTEDAVGGYSGAAPGSSASFSTFSKPADVYNDPTFAAPLLEYAEIQFYLAEAVERGFAVGGTAASHYNSAVAASISSWGGSAADATAYLAQPTVAYATASGTYKQKIGTQKWIALYDRPWDSWTEQRRLNFPALTVPATARTGYPVRLTYPVNEQNINTSNYNAAAAAIGTDKPTTKLFWDKN